MRRRRGLSVPEDVPGMSEINITPLTDVLLVLLVIFLLTATAAHRFGFPVSAAGSGDSVSPQQALVVEVAAGGALRLADRTVTLEQLPAKVRAWIQANPAGTVVVTAQGDASYGLVVQTIDAVRQGGVESVSLAGG